MWICEKDGHCVDSCEGCEHYVEMVEVKRGRWLSPKTPKGSAVILCSECKKSADWGYNFCPNCGADMRGVNHAKT